MGETVEKIYCCDRDNNDTSYICYYQPAWNDSRTY